MPRARVLRICDGSSPYEVYPELSFDIPVGVTGDCCDRYLVRVEEMRQSNEIIRQCVRWLRANPGAVMLDDHKLAPSRTDMKDDMESLIHHFKLFTEGYSTPPGRYIKRSRHPRGVWDLYRVRWGEQALSIEDPGSRICAPCISG